MTSSPSTSGTTSGAQVSECFLQGIVSESSKEALVQKLKGFCQSVEVPFHQREVVYKSIPVPGTAQTEFRVRFDVFTKKWTLKLVGSLLIKGKLPVNVRSVTEVKVSDNVEAFLDAFGYKYDFEFYREGTESIAVVGDRKYSISLAKIKQQATSTDEFDESTAGTWFVELCSYSTDEDVNQAAEEMNSFAEFLSPVVELAKLDYKTMQVKKAVAPPVRRNP